MIPIDSDTICAVATAPGRSGVGIVRISGPDARRIANSILSFSPTPRYAHYCNFYSIKGEIIDQGIALFFEGPNSFTGEDVLELQGHGGTIIVNRLCNTVLDFGARIARPGEFSERSFINGKIDLAQAEAVADLIDATTDHAAKSALRTLQGEFSRLINTLLVELTTIRVNVEASIDFSDEDIEFIESNSVSMSLDRILDTLDGIFRQAKKGALLKEGINLVIAGKPNAGKSSLLNALSGEETAIVTNIAGTTRDTLNTELSLDGLPIHVTDTAGLRDSDDVVEKEGVRRALSAIDKAERVLLVIDASGVEVFNKNDTGNPLTIDTGFLNSYFKKFQTSELPVLEHLNKATLIFNKIDKLELPPFYTNLSGISLDSTASEDSLVAIGLSAKTHEGLDLLREHLKTIIGYDSTEEGSFMARERHLRALESCRNHLLQVRENIFAARELELAAEDLRLAQQDLSSITGEFTSDDLLGEIFSNFCVGK